MSKPRMPKINYKSSRIEWIDFVRAIAILLMIVTHVVIIFFNFEGNSIFDTGLEYISLLGGTLAFTIFLFISGATIYHVLLKKDDMEKRTRKFAFRSLKLILIYYVLSILLNYAFNKIFLRNDIESVSRDLVDILLFVKLPPLAEFLIPFVFIPLIVVILSKETKSLIKTRFGLPLIGIALYIIGSYLSRIHLENEIYIGIKSIFVGAGPLINSFPIFQYTLVFLVGISFAYEYEKIQKASSKIMFNLIAVIISIVLILSSFYIFENYRQAHIFDVSVYTGRFPPSIPFLLYGFISVSILLIAKDAYTIISSRIKYFKVHRIFPVYRPIMYIGTKALNFYVWHILILVVPLILQNKFESKVTSDSTLRTTVIYVFVVGLIYLLCKFSDHKYLNGLISRVLSLIKNLSPFLVAITILSSVFMLASYYVKVQPNVAAMSFNRIIKFGNAESWWDDTYAFRSEISMNNQNNNKYFITIPKSTLSSIGVFNNSGFTNFRLVDQTRGEGSEIPIQIDNENTVVNIYFEVDLLPDRLYLYSGSNYEPTTYEPYEKEGGYSPATLGEFQSKQVQISNRNDWYLKSWSSETDTNININTNLLYQDVLSAEISVLDTEISKDLEVTNTEAIVSMPEIENLEPGIYRIQAKYVVFENTLKVYTSNIFYLNVSYPLFVNWSLDFEGYGVAQAELDEIAKITDKYNMQITHYFNPRIYIPNQYSFTSISQNSANYLTNWVLNRRRQFGDEIGLHVHMFADFEEEIEKFYFSDVENNAPQPTEEEISVESEPTDAETGYLEGADVVGSAENTGIDANPGSKLQGLARTENKLQGYSEEDLILIFEWSVNKFKEKGLGQPTSFRSGAWMSGTNVLRALAANGIKIDSTGRSGGLLNPNVASSTKIPWNLPITQKPYYPNQNDINSAAEPTIDILEIPNNGADSYWFSTKEMINRFDLNYDAYSNEDGIMVEPQVVTYLSHPHGFITYDSQKIRGMLDHVSKFDSANGNGPVVFTTLEKIYNNFDITKF